MTPIFPVRIDLGKVRFKDGFTFIEVTIALMITCILVSTTAAVCLQALRLNRSGREMMLLSLAMQQQSCRHRLLNPPDDIADLNNRPVETNAFTHVQARWELYDKRWLICTLTADDRFDSLESCLAFQYRK